MLILDRPLVFVDTETTHLEEEIAHPWEIALIRRPEGAVDASDDEVTHIMLAQPIMAGADPKALKVGRFHERHTPDGPHVWASRRYAAELVAEATRPDDATGRRAALIGSKPDYDATMLTKLLHGSGRRGGWRFEPVWHHHFHDLAGWTLATLAASVVDQGALSMGSYELSEAVGADRPTGDAAHTALGDALWVRRWWDQLMTGVVG